MDSHSDFNGIRYAYVQTIFESGVKVSAWHKMSKTDNIINGSKTTKKWHWLYGFFHSLTKMLPAIEPSKPPTDPERDLERSSSLSPCSTGGLSISESFLTESWSCWQHSNVIAAVYRQHKHHWKATGMPFRSPALKEKSVTFGMQQTHIQSK